ncbi:MAG: hypothetical protein Q7K42_05845, partial [Candidatus Diapherotrites archaeon]|nr:hypothetical protein [Candidatus Diapherotrites archaeon]
MPDITKEKPSGEASIIQIIQEMVAAGENEEKIIATLEQLGVDAAQAKKLLLIGQSDVFALLKNEIHKIVIDDLTRERPNVDKYIEDRARKLTKDIADEEASVMKKNIKEWEEDVASKSTKFQKQINDTVQSVTELSDRVRDQLNVLGEQVQQVRLDLEELKLTGIGKRNQTIGTIVLGLGILFILVALGIAGFFFLQNN